jgi:hypothetical protein
VRGKIGLDVLRLGDVVLVAGTSVFSRLARMIEGTSFDHCMMVAPPDPLHPKFGRSSDDDRTHEIWAYDVGFFGGRHQPLSAYDDVVSALAVRRHRNPDIAEKVIARGLTITKATKGYAWDRLLFLSLIGATRWSPGLSELDPEKSSAMMKALYEVLAQMHRSIRFEVPGERRICTELITDTFDEFVPAAEQRNDFPENYLGLVTPGIPHEGLLWWAAGMSTFQDFIARQPPPKRRGILDEDLALAPGSEEALQLVHEAATSNGVSFPGFSPASDEELRAVVIDGVERSLQNLIGQPWRGDLRAATDPRRVAWFLLDTLMRKRAVVTPADLGATKSLFDVGLIDAAEVSWHPGERTHS